MSGLSRHKCLLNAFSVPVSHYALGWLLAGVVWANTMQMASRTPPSGDEIVKGDFPRGLQSVFFPA